MVKQGFEEGPCVLSKLKSVTHLAQVGAISKAMRLCVLPKSLLLQFPSMKWSLQCPINPSWESLAEGAGESWQWESAATLVALVLHRA